MTVQTQAPADSRRQMTDDWYADHRNLADLWRWLERRCEEPSDPYELLEKPWKWEPEWNEMQAELAREGLPA